MTMRFRLNESVTTADWGAKVIFAWYDFMTSASPAGPGWICKDSVNDSGTQGTNVISSYNDLITYSATRPWFVLQSPAGAGGPEILWHRVDGNQYNWDIRYSRAAGFSGGNPTTPPTASDSVLAFGGFSSVLEDVNQRWQYGADDATPYGFYMFGYKTDYVMQGSMAFIPMAASVSGDPDPYVLSFGDITYETWDNDYWFSYVKDTWQFGAKNVALIPGSTTMAMIAALTMQYSTTAANWVKCVPDLVPVSPAYKEQPIPIVWMRPVGHPAPNGYKGVSDFMMWNPTGRQTGTTFESKAYVVAGQFVLPWDGSTTPLAAP